jgi:hypothetical protein
VGEALVWLVAGMEQVEVEVEVDWVIKIIIR